MTTQYFTPKKTDFSPFATTSAAVVLWTTTLAGLGGPRNVNVLDVYSGEQKTIVSRSSAPLSDAVQITDSATVDWLNFQALLKEWHLERGVSSSITEAAMMPAYQKIVGMGKPVVPLILKQLRSEGDEPDQWFWALRSITGANPVQPQDQGNFRRMAEAWLTWGQTERNGW